MVKVLSFFNSDLFYSTLLMSGDVEKGIFEIWLEKLSWDTFSLVFKG